MYIYIYIYIYVCVCVCMLLAAICMVCYWLNAYYLWCASVWMLYRYGCICVSLCNAILLHPYSYNIVRYGFCLTVLCYLMVCL